MVGDAHNKPTANARRRRAEKAGRDAERAVADHLTQRGWLVIDQRYKTPYGEIDLIAQNDGIVAFIEVKARSSLADGLYAITVKARKRIAEAASVWIAEKGDDLRSIDTFRFDVAVVTPAERGSAISITENAFTLDD